MSQNSICTQCHLPFETLAHVLRNCEDVKSFWEGFIKNDTWYKFSSMVHMLGSHGIYLTSQLIIYPFVILVLLFGLMEKYINNMGFS